MADLKHCHWKVSVASSFWHIKLAFLNALNETSKQEPSVVTRMGEGADAGNAASLIVQYKNPSRIRL